MTRGQFKCSSGTLACIAANFAFSVWAVRFGAVEVAWCLGMCLLCVLISTLECTWEDYGQ